MKFDCEIRATCTIEAENEEDACEKASELSMDKWQWDYPTAECAEIKENI